MQESKNDRKKKMTGFCAVKTLKTKKRKRNEFKGIQEEKELKMSSKVSR